MLQKNLLGHVLAMKDDRPIKLHDRRIRRHFKPHSWEVMIHT